MATNMIQLPIQPPIYPNTGSLPAGATAGSQAIVLSSPPTIYIYDGSSWVLVTSGGVTAVNSVTSAGLGLTASPTTGDVVLTLAQSILTSATPTFASIILSTTPTLNYIWTCTNGTTGAGAWMAPPTVGITTLTGDVTASGSGSVVATISNNVVTYAKIQTLVANSLIGNPTGSTATSQAVTLGTSLAFSGTALNTIQSITTASTPTFASINLSTSPTLNYIWTCTNAGTGAGSWQVNAAVGAGVTSITGTANQVIASASTGAVVLSTPQDIATTSNVQFARIGINTANSSGALLQVNGTAVFGGTSLVSNSQTTITQSSTNYGYALAINGTLSTANSSIGLYVNRTVTSTSTAGLYGIAIDDTFRGSSGGSLTINSIQQLWVKGTVNVAAGSITVSNIYGILIDTQQVSGVTATANYGAYVKTPSTGHGGTTTALYADDLIVGFPVVTPPTNGLLVAGRCVFGGNSSPPGGSSSLVTISHPTNPELIFAATTAASNTKYWAFATNSGATNNTFYGYTWNDALSANSLWLEVQRNTTSQNIQYIRFRNGKTMFGSASDPVNTVDIAGAVTIGSYAGVNTAPTNGAAISGAVLIATTTQDGSNLLTVNGGISSSGARFSTSPTTGYVWTSSDGSGNGSWQHVNANGNYINYNVTSVKTSNYTASATDEVIPVDTTSGVVTITLPAGSGGRGYTIIDVGGLASVNNILIQGTGLFIINGLPLSTQYNMSQNYGRAECQFWGNVASNDRWSITTVRT